MKELVNIKQTLILGDEETFFQLLDAFYKRVKEENISDGDTFLSETEVMNLLKISSKSTLWSYRSNGLTYHQIGKRVILYKKSDVIEFINQHKVKGF